MMTSELAHLKLFVLEKYNNKKTALLKAS